jgi:hypothetical protein
MITKNDLHDLVDELSDDVLVAAEAYLVFLRDRDTRPAQSSNRTHGPGRLIGQGWADNERRGIERRRQDRDGTEPNPHPDNHA